MTQGPYAQGQTLPTPQTRRWTPAQIAANDAIEACLVFANFSASDEGRGRVLICRCERAEDAVFIVAACNAAFERMAKENADRPPSGSTLPRLRPDA